MTNHNLNHHDPELDALIDQLDTLASTDQSTPDAQFEQRVMDSISSQIAPAPLSIEQPNAESESRPAQLIPGWMFNIAAGLLIVGSISVLLWSSTRTSVMIAQPTADQTLVSLEESFDLLFELPEIGESLGTSIDEVDLMTDAMHTELSLPSALMDLSDQLLSEESL